MLITKFVSYVIRIILEVKLILIASNARFYLIKKIFYEKVVLQFSLNKSENAILGIRVQGTNMLICLGELYEKFLWFCQCLKVVPQ